DDKDVTALAASIADLALHTRQARTAQWVALQMADKGNLALCDADTCLNIDNLDLSPYTKCAGGLTVLNKKNSAGEDREVSNAGFKVSVDADVKSREDDDFVADQKHGSGDCQGNSGVNDDVMFSAVTANVTEDVPRQSTDRDQARTGGGGDHHENLVQGVRDDFVSVTSESTGHGSDTVEANVNFFIREGLDKLSTENNDDEDQTDCDQTQVCQKSEDAGEDGDDEEEKEGEDC
ncbi:hypothetical protein EGW08_005716, partial [Elysia chlorotica]